MAQSTTTTLKLYTRTTLTTLWTGLSLFILAQTSHAQQSDSVYQKMPFLKSYESLLAEYVQDHKKGDMAGTGINYLEWQRDPRHKIAMEALESTSLTELTSKEEKLSFWINAYNLLTIDLIIKNGEQQSIHNLGGLVGDPWNEFSWVIDGLETTLSQIQHQTLRSMGEPRTHFSLTCAALSCPDLKNTPYWPKRIYTQLEKQTRKFLRNPHKGVTIIKAEPKNTRIQQTDKYKASQIFQWFKNDFEHGNIQRFIQRYVFLYGAEFDGYLPHNWQLNSLEGKEPLAVEKANTQPWSLGKAMP